MEIFDLFDKDNTLQFRIMYSTFSLETITSILSISKTIFICTILIIGSLLFSYDAQKLVLIPIERMIEKVKILSKDPIEVAKADPTKVGILA